LVQTVSALRFLYEKTLHRPWTVDYIPFPKKIKTLPLVLSRAEVQTLIQTPRHLKHRIILATLYTGEVRRRGKTRQDHRWRRQALVARTHAAAKTKGTDLVERRLVTRLEQLGYEAALQPIATAS
jgi:hypothetical protein